MIKRSFLAGLAILLPLALTFMIVSFILGLLTKPFMDLSVSLMKHFEVFHQPFFFLTGEQVATFMSEIIVLAALFLIILLVGVLGNLFLFKYLGYLGEYILYRVPIVNKIYKGIQDIITTIFSPSKTTFSSVVLVPFPHKETKSIGLITKGQIPEGSNAVEDPRLSVFLPGTPNPSMGFMLMFRRSEIIHLNMSVEEALKFLVSCGVVYPESISVQQNNQTK